MVLRILGLGARGLGFTGFKVLGFPIAQCNGAGFKLRVYAGFIGFQGSGLNSIQVCSLWVRG